jgi:hypothetical protein
MGDRLHVSLTGMLGSARNARCSGGRCVDYGSQRESHSLMIEHGRVLLSVAPYSLPRYRKKKWDLCRKGRGMMALGHHLGDRLCRPVERVSRAVPLSNKGKQAISERCHAGKTRCCFNAARSTWHVSWRMSSIRRCIKMRSIWI